MTVGQLGMKHPSLAGMVAAIEARLSREALHKRFTAPASAFLEKCLQFVLRQKMGRIGAIDNKILSRFKRVVILDSSSWEVDDALRHALPGSGGGASRANCKIQAVYEYRKGELTFLETTSGILPDNRFADSLPGLVNEGDLALVDQGYFKIQVFENIDRKKAFFLTRFLLRTGLRDPATGTSIDLERLLRKSGDDVFEKRVILGGEKHSDDFQCRLVCMRVSEQTANERRRRMKENDRRKGRTTSQKRLFFCSWTLLVTNIPEPWLPAKMAFALYILRWQIELLFKQLKSVLRIHKSDTTREHRLRCELYGKLILAVLVHRIHAAANVELWNRDRREVSMEKLYKRIQERAFVLMKQLLRSRRAAILYLRKEISEILRHCLKIRQPSRPTTLETLESGVDQRLEVEKMTR